MKKTAFIAFAALAVFLFAVRGGFRTSLDAEEYPSMKLTSTSFTNGGHLQEAYTCKGPGMSPPLSFLDVPDTAKSLALTVVDPMALNGSFVHWVIWNIPPSSDGLGEDIEPIARLHEGIRQGLNTKGTSGYIAPCPPSGNHAYYFTLYALDSMLELDDSAGLPELTSAMTGHIIAQATMVGWFPEIGG
jgi:Raf kinase inhibitor-like YbhB/YbcL family protein